MNRLMLLSKMLFLYQNPIFVFGNSPEIADSVYQALLNEMNPDNNPGEEVFAEATAGYLLTLKDRADRNINNRSYYISEDDISKTYKTYFGDLSHRKYGHAQNYLDFFQNEAVILNTITRQIGFNQVRELFLDCFVVDPLIQGYEFRTENLYREDVFSLRELLSAFGEDFDVRHISWIWPQILDALDFTHNAAGIVHGALTTNNILISPLKQKVIIDNWYYSFEIGTLLKGIGIAQTGCYPRALRDEAAPRLDLERWSTPSLDTVVVAKSILSYWDMPLFLRNYFSDISQTGVTNIEILRQEFGHIIYDNLGWARNEPVLFPWIDWKSYREDVLDGYID